MLLTKVLGVIHCFINYQVHDFNSDGKQIILAHNS